MCHTINQSLANFVGPHTYASWSAAGFNCKAQQCQYDHNHIFYIYHYILYMVSVISHTRGHREVSKRDSNHFATHTELS